MIKMGTWIVNSKSDPRWNKTGRGMGDAFSGPTEMSDWIKECTEKYGDPPKDATKEFWKD